MAYEDDQQDTTEENGEQEADHASEELSKALAKHERKLRRQQWRFRTAGSISGLIGSVLVGVLIGISMMFLTSIFLNLTPVAITTESMTGTVNAGDIALTQKYFGQPLEVGDVVLVQPEEGSPVLHRIVEVNHDGSYVTRGDANDANDLFEPKPEDIIGVLFNPIGQPVASWYATFQQPIAWLLVLAAAVVFRFGVPRLLNLRIDKLNRREAVELERIKLSVAAHEDSISSHDDTFSEVVPVVEELKADSEAQKAEKELEGKLAATAQENALSFLLKADEDTPIYDDFEGNATNPFTEVFESDGDTEDPLPVITGENSTLPFPTFGAERITGTPQPMRDCSPPFEETALPTVPTSAPPIDAHDFVRDLAARYKSPVPITRASLRASLASNASTRAPESAHARLAHSAFAPVED